MDVVLGILVLAIGWSIGGWILHGHPRYQNSSGAHAAPGKGRGGRAARARATGRASRIPRDSWLVKAWNSAAPNHQTEEKTLRGATAVLTGKAAGNVGRHGTRFTTRAGQAVGRTFHRKVLRPAGKGAAATGRATARAADRRWAGRAADAISVIRLFRKRDGSYGPEGPADGDTGPTPRPAPAAAGGSAGSPSIPRSPATASSNGSAAGASASNGSSTAKVIPLAAPPQTATQTSMNTPAPGDWAQVISRINGFVPGKDYELLMFMQQETAGMLNYATALIHLFETCTTVKGLDPNAMNGLAEYSAAAGDAAQAMTLAHRRFVTVYNEIMQAVQRGVVMPFDGRFFTADAS